MKKSNNNEKQQFLLEFSRSSSILLFKCALSEITKKRIQCLFFDSNLKPVTKKKKVHEGITKALKKLKSQRLNKTQNLQCSCGKTCVFLPIIQDENLYGYVAMMHLDHESEKKDIILFKSIIDVALKEFQKEQELVRLYDTIRPRAIALSTIHTIHRLISSTLDLTELIERITRLTSQVMRARYCSIMLLDNSRKHLITKAATDLRNHANKKNARLKKIKVGTGIEGKVAKTGKTFMSRNTICVPLVEEDIIGTICAKNKIKNTSFTKFDMEILLTLAEQAVIAIKNAQLYEEQDKMAYGSIKSLAALLDAKSPNTYTHSEIFVKIVLAIAEEMKLPREEIRNLRYAALLPDTGKFSIPDEILKKRGRLSREEFGIIKRQHLESLKILQPLEFLKPSMPIIMHHHERYDGSGYPKGLKGEEIPLGARIMTVADAYEAMICSRPYKDRNITISQALKEIENNKGAQFDPNVVDAFISIAKKPEFKRLLQIK